VEDESRQPIATGLSLDEANELALNLFKQNRTLYGVKPERLGGESDGDRQPSSA
jgi:hypothetical protein